MIGALSTKYVGTSGSDRLQLHDLFRITFVAPKEIFLSTDQESAEFGDGINRLYDDNGSILVPTSLNPYTPGTLTATIDFLYPSTAPASVADAINDLLDAGAPFGFDALAPFDITRVEKVIGAGALKPGTKAAGDAGYGPDAGDQRAKDDADAELERQKRQDALDKLFEGLATAGKIVAGVAIVGGIVYVVAQAAPFLKVAKKATS